MRDKDGPLRFGVAEARVGSQVRTVTVLFLRMSSTALTAARPCSSPTWWRAPTLSACELLTLTGPQTRTPPQWKCGQVRAGLPGLRSWGWPVSGGCGELCLWGSLQVAVEPRVGSQAHLVVFSTRGHLSPNRPSLGTLGEHWA